jgi:hypothetical protein
MVSWSGGVACCCRLPVTFWANGHSCNGGAGAIADKCDLSWGERLTSGLIKGQFTVPSGWTIHASAALGVKSPLFSCCQIRVWALSNSAAETLAML